MKKYFLILILLLIDISLYLYKSKNYIVKPIDLNLDNNELALTIFSLENSKSILINKSDLLILEYIDSNSIQDNLDLYKIDILDNVILSDDIAPNIKSYNKVSLNKRIELNNAQILKKDNIIYINYSNYSFCIYKTGFNKDLSSCDFVYFLSLDDIDFTDELLVAFFDYSIDKDKIEKYYDKWVDSYILNKKSFYSLKLSYDDYSVLEILKN